MKIIVHGPRRRVGVLTHRGIVDVNSAYAKYASESLGEPAPYVLANAMAPSDLRDFIDAGSRALDATQHALQYLEQEAQDERSPDGDQVVLGLESAHIHPPLASRANRIVNLGTNFADHVCAYRLYRLGETVTIEDARQELRAQGIWGFYKPASAAIGHDDDLIYPAHTMQLDYEGEVAIVFARNAKNEAAGSLDDAIWGYTLQNDWSLRDQTENPLSSLALAKNFDGSSSLGPCIVVNEIDDPTDVPFETRVNGELRQQGTTADMVFSFGEAFEYLSRHFTLQPGDILSAGTNAGTAIDLPPNENGELDLSRFASPGDVVEISSPLIGTLRNRVVAA
jgi:2-keto-4-pentenoate hydratase/2-oxohepta-3-ene-1,7-dioic acid hydratase in catechol pathway